MFLDFLDLQNNILTPLSLFLIFEFLDIFFFLQILKLNLDIWSSELRKDELF